MLPIPKYLTPLLGTISILVLDSFVNNIILLGTQGILGKYSVSSSLVLFFPFFYRFASSVVFQTYSHLKKQGQLILGKMIYWYKSWPRKKLQLSQITWLSSLSKLELSLLRIYRFWKSSPLSSLICSLNFWSGLKKPHGKRRDSTHYLQ